MAASQSSAALEGSASRCRSL
ncbi:hypothetical protein E2C01_082975 [Portunus trituberculatus]|uniref:Uncharacterized protein n=1 Tax=Portunus trituberculatus TaxID=210409 RepID=A0A5B7IZX1_PORTR|nr:hypothetical protein [Portunus trituberculatus]